MKKRYRLLSLFGVLALALALTACQGSTPPPATAKATEPPQPTTATTETKPESAVTQETTESAVDCQPYTSPFGEVTEKDWVVGPENAPVTMIEYSDFQ